MARAHRRRRDRRTAGLNSEKVAKISQTILNVPPYDLVNTGQLQYIHDKSMQILEEGGVVLYNDEAHWYCLCPNGCTGYTLYLRFIPAVIDLQSGAPVFGAPESQLARHYGLPFRAAGAYASLKLLMPRVRMKVSCRYCPYCLPSLILYCMPLAGWRRI